MTVADVHVPAALPDVSVAYEQIDEDDADKAKKKPKLKKADVSMKYDVRKMDDDKKQIFGWASVAAVDGVAVGAGAIIAMAADLRLATPEAKCAFLFTRVGLAGCDMGACAILPRLIGQGRAAELLYTGRTMSAAEGERWGFWNALHPAAELEAQARALQKRLDDPDLFTRDRTGFEQTMAKLADVQTKLEDAEARWLELEILREESGG
jgi:enoyl-CoA hydratase/carnithine racemase